MKSIVIAESLKPFQHTAGTTMPLPRSTFFVVVFPASISILQFEEGCAREVADISLNFKGPIKDFTAQLDLERGCIHVWGHSVRGYFRYHLSFIPEKNKIGVWLEKKPETCENPFLSHALFSEILSLPITQPIERLSLGNHKAQDWNLVKQRQNLREILPALFLLGQHIPSSNLELPCGGTSDFLLRIDSLIQEKNRREICSGLLNFFNCAFSGILVPRLTDEDHLGFDLSPSNFKSSPFAILIQGVRLIRDLFLRQEGKEITLLPLLAPEFHCGRAKGFKLPGVGVIDIEWTKNLVRRAIIYADQPCELVLHFQKEIKECRLNKRMCYLPGTFLHLEGNSVTYLDCFRK